MKKIISLFLVTLLVLSIAACSGPDTEQTTAPAVYENVFQVGYGRADITPTETVPLGGRGNTSGGEWSQNIMDHLYVTCIAFKGADGETVLMFTGDAISPGAYCVDPMKAAVSEATGIPTDKITYTATHSHSTVDMSQGSKYESVYRYNAMFTEQGVQAAKEALADLAPAQVSVGSVETENLNFTRHYILEDGSYAGDGFGTWLDSDPVAHTRQADTTMYIVRFAREDKKDVVLANWRAHPSLTSSGYDISADYVGSFREAFEAQYDAHFAYYQGAAGNVNASTRINAEKRAMDHEEHGALLAGYAIECLEGNMKDIQVEDVNHQYLDFTAKVNHSKDHMVLEARTVQAYRDTLKVYSAVKPYAEALGFHSMYEATFVLKRAEMPESQEVTVGVMTLGEDLAIVFHPGEMFSEISEQLEEQSPYETTLWFSYSNDAQGYWPSEFAWTYECYGTDIGLYEAGTSENLRDFFTEKLQQMKES